MVFTGQFKNALKVACAAIRNGEASPEFVKVGDIMVSTGFVVQVEIKPCTRFSKYTFRVTTHGMINERGPLVVLERVEYETDSIADILETLSLCAHLEVFDELHAHYVRASAGITYENARDHLVNPLPSETTPKEVKHYVVTTTDNENEKLFLTDAGLWTYYRHNAKEHMVKPESTDKLSDYGTAIKVESFTPTFIGIGIANVKRIKITTNAGMVLIAPLYAVAMHDDGAVFSQRWLMRLNLIENKEFCSYVKPEMIKTLEYIK
jgi:hypothetical protein